MSPMHLRTHSARGVPSAVVNTPSMAGEYGVEEMGPYSAAKAGVIAFTKTLARESAEDDVRVNAVSPGFIATEKLREQFGCENVIDRQNADRKFGTPAEVADLVRYLASDAASFVNGRSSSHHTVPPNTYETPSL